VSGLVSRAERAADRTRPGPFHSRYWVLRLLFEELTRIVDSDRWSSGARVLDYGCGSRPYEPLLARRFTTYVGADFGGNKAADVAIGRGGELPVEGQSIDCVLSTQVLEHVEDPQAYLAEAYRVLTASGALILSTHGVWRYHPNPGDYWRWTADGLQAEIYRAAFDIIRMRSVLGMASCGRQLWQDATAPGLPRLLRPLYFWCIQSVIGLIERSRAAGLSPGACVHVVLARKRARRDLLGADLETHRLTLAREELHALIPPRTSFVLIDDGQWVEHLGADRHPVPFLERDGQDWGPPSDDREAIREIGRLRRGGARFVVFARPAFWWLDHYRGLCRHLRANHACVVENDRLVVFALEAGGHSCTTR
jgi:SAM-dependent methyltransferase